MRGSMSGEQQVWSEAEITALLDELPADLRLILPALQWVQERVGYVPEVAISTVARFLNVSRADVFGVLTYYHDLRRVPPAPVVVALCTAEACQASGARELTAAVAERIARVGERSADGQVEVNEVFCLGNCALGPAAFVNERLLGRLDIDRLDTAVAAAKAEAVR
jgi:formate dehydrogenase subunit gamma